MAEEIEKGSFKHLIVQIVIMTVLAMILWPIFDLLVCLLFTHSPFAYSPMEHIVKPIIFGVVIGLLFWLPDRAKAGKAGKSEKKKK